MNWILEVQQLNTSNDILDKEFDLSRITIKELISQGDEDLVIYANFNFYKYYISEN
jgi:hypothetical protein